ncbi:alpha/beta hydrolase, partial [Streptomyces sp. T-3]|nr:alpha/beta hydrolase [Streptomyces sp. T-3]
PRAVVVAVHGRGMRAGYFHAGAHPDASLLDLAARLGHPVLAVDRPGYGLSARQLPMGQTLAEQAVTVRAALAAYAEENDIGAGYFVLAHSYGGKLAVQLAAGDTGNSLIGLDISGMGRDYAPEAYGFPATLSDGAFRLNWGPMRLYPPGTFRAARRLMTPTPHREEHERLPPWPVRFPRLAAGVRVPVRLTFAEHELWWRTDDASLASLAAQFTAAPRVQVDREPAAGHNISMGHAARAHHLRALAFLEDCLRAS